nr:LysE family translocator [uncultured Gellertiella sp.]
MPGLHLLVPFFLTTALFAAIPGPAMLYAAARTMARGRKAGLMASLGIHLGGYLHVCAAAAGLSFLFRAVPVFYLVVKLAGAAWLVWLGIGLFLGTGRNDTAEADTEAGEGAAENVAASARSAFLQSIAVEALNPKTALFFLAFLPQFVDPQAAFPVWLQLGLLGTIVNLIFSAADLACVFLASAVMGRLSRSTRMVRGLQRLGGTVIAGLGLHLAFDRS